METMETGLRVPGLRIGQAGQALEDEVGHPLTVKERTGSQSVRMCEARRVFIASCVSFVRYSYSRPRTSNM